jgi:hypothetical protein
MAAQNGGVIDLRDPNATPDERVAKLQALKEQGLLDDAQFDAAGRRSSVRTAAGRRSATGSRTAGQSF